VRDESCGGQQLRQRSGFAASAILDACDGSTITFANTVASPITLSAELAIDKNLTIQGPGANLFTISGNNSVRVFNIGSVNPAINVTLSGLGILNGNPGLNQPGGGVLDNSTGTLNVINAIISGNTAFDVFNREAGGGIYHASTGTMNVTNSIVSGNTVFTSRGGGIFNGPGTLVVTNSTLSGNSALLGGAILNEGGTVSVAYSNISGNPVEAVGGGLGRRYW